MRRRGSKQAGKCNLLNRVEPPSAKQEDRLWLYGQLGTDNTDKVQYTRWYLGAKLLGFKCSHDPRQFQWGGEGKRGDLVRTLNYLELISRSMRPTGNNDPMPFAPKMFPNVADPSQVSHEVA